MLDVTPQERFCIKVLEAISISLKNPYIDVETSGTVSAGYMSLMIRFYSLPQLVLLDV